MRLWLKYLLLDIVILTRPYLKFIPPNALTFARLVLTGWAAVVMNFPSAWHPFAPFKFAVVILIVAALTDVFDGPIARKLDAVSRFGDGADHVIDAIMAGLFLYQGYILLDSAVFWLLLLGQIMTMEIAINHFTVGLKEGWPNKWGRTSFILFVVAMCLRMITVDGVDETMGYEVSTMLAMCALIFRAWSFKEYWVFLGTEPDVKGGG